MILNVLLSVKSDSGYLSQMAILNILGNFECHHLLPVSSLWLFTDFFWKKIN